MKKFKEKGFTLIELIAVLVIMAIIALIVTPLVMSIIRKAKISARKRSVDAYGRSVELAISSYLMDTGTFPTNEQLPNLQVEYSGSTVVCNVMTMKENGGLYLSECKVNNVEVKDDSTDDGYYHYGTRDLTNEEYIDMYGKNVEAALKTYYNTNNAYPDSIDNLNIESVGKTVSCTSSINSDGTVYLTNCIVDGVSVSDTNQEDGYYHYGIMKYKSYTLGNSVTYNGVDYYVIKDSGENEESVTLLKSEPLTVAEVNEYGGVGTSNNHVNVYVKSNTSTSSLYYQTAYNNNGYGGMAYYTSETCGYDNNNQKQESGCTTDYEVSDIKYVVDAWAATNISNGLIVARLITVEDLSDNLGYLWGKLDASTEGWVKSENTPTWLYNGNYDYWTMSHYKDSLAGLWKVTSSGKMSNKNVWDISYTVVRPVIVLSKSVL